MDFAVEIPLTRCPSWRNVATTANGQPAIACYLGMTPDSRHIGWSITVLTLRGDKIAGLTSFIGPEHFELLGLPASR
jgi:RNA polymerase sigma-70 factor (ECF subfamily)